MTEPREDAVSPLELLFAYGTLGPDLDGTATGSNPDGWRRDAVRGRLFDLGPYPALIDLDHPEAGWVEGHVRTVTASELNDHLDPYEGVQDGLYRRAATSTRAGLAVWVYVYRRGLPPTARGPLAHWRAPDRA